MIQYLVVWHTLKVQINCQKDELDLSYTSSVSGWWVVCRSYSICTGSSWVDLEAWYFFSCLEWEGSKCDDFIKKDSVAPNVWHWCEDSIWQTLWGHPADREHSFYQIRPKILWTNTPTFSAKSVILALCNEASHTKICEFNISIRVHKAVSACQVSAVEGEYFVRSKVLCQTCGHIYSVQDRPSHTPRLLPLKWASCYSPKYI